MPKSSEILLFQPACLPFSTALAVVLGIALLEALSLMFGAGLGHVLDSVVPDQDLDLDVGGVSALDKLLGWLHVGKLPLLVVLICALTWFGVVGLTLQGALSAFWGIYAPAWLAAVLALLPAFPLTHVTAALLARVLPRDETSAVARASFVGRVGMMLQAPATRGAPAQAKLRDRFGQVHYILVEPEDEQQILEPGQEILIVRQDGVRFTAIRNTHAVLSAGERGR